MRGLGVWGGLFRESPSRLCVIVAAGSAYREGSVPGRIGGGHLDANAAGGGARRAQRHVVAIIRCR